MTAPLKRAIKTIVRVADPDKVILFGSHVKDEAKKSSDLDLLVLKRNLRNQRKLVQRIYMNFKNIGAPVDLLAADSRKFEELKNDSFSIYFEAFNNGEVVYDKERESKRLAKTSKK